tara:strand:- start:1213 stop:1911 length:699 start_codon:yes stop_codon:yes gene_type:complete
MSNQTSVAIMQPYIFPYIGQLNLIQAVDKFVFFDDVNFVTKGFIHKNTILINEQIHTFIIPIKNKSQNTLIKDTVILDIQKFKYNFFIKLERAYKKSKFFTQGMEYVKTVLDFNSKYISDFAIYSITQFFNFLDINKDFYKSSTLSPESRGLKPASDRLIKITKMLDSNYYINGPGGFTYGLYDKDHFTKNKVKLNFLQPNVVKGQELSIIHLMMHNSKEQLLEKLNDYTLF